MAGLLFGGVRLVPGRVFVRGVSQFCAGSHSICIVPVVEYARLVFLQLCADRGLRPRLRFAVHDARAPRSGVARAVVDGVDQVELSAVDCVDFKLVGHGVPVRYCLVEQPYQVARARAVVSFCGRFDPVFQVEWYVECERRFVHCVVPLLVSAFLCCFSTKTFSHIRLEPSTLFHVERLDCDVCTCPPRKTFCLWPPLRPMPSVIQCVEASTPVWAYPRRDGERVRALARPRSGNPLSSYFRSRFFGDVNV